MVYTGFDAVDVKCHFYASFCGRKMPNLRLAAFWDRGPGRGTPGANLRWKGGADVAPAAKPPHAPTAVPPLEPSSRPAPTNLRETSNRLLAAK